MIEDKQMPIKLAIADSQITLHVASFTGREALNEPYCFEIELVSNQPHVDLKDLVRRFAFLTFGNDEQGIHGHISKASQVYAGTCLSLYRLNLTPTLQRLETRRQRRVFHNKSAPQLITQLLEEHGIPSETWRFDALTGTYPPRELCVQYDETDLHLLQRLCEEEGLHFRFEHSQARHLLIFADDPASFPEQSAPVCFHAEPMDNGPQPTISYLAEQLTLRPSLNSHSSEPSASLPASGTQASNQPFQTSVGPPCPTPLDAHRLQLGARRLERLRCERRTIIGRSQYCGLLSGSIIALQKHPEPVFNDQLLLVSIQHSGEQPAVLKGCDPHDTRAIVAALNTTSRPPRQPSTRLPSSVSQKDPLRQGYHNSFRVLPWVLPFRPSLQHPKPSVSGRQPAMLLAAGSPVGPLRRVPIRFNWQSAQASSTPSGHLLAEVCGLADLSNGKWPAGTPVQTGYFDSDPHHPVICGLPDGNDAQSSDLETGKDLQIDGQKTDPRQSVIHLNKGQRLHLHTCEPVRINTGQAILEVNAEGIRLMGQTNLLVAQRCGLAPERPVALLPIDTDLRLIDDQTRSRMPLTHRVWYIVRMSAPDLHALARLQPDSFLFEGRTDEHGLLGLEAEQLQKLAEEYRRTPDDLCLVHPGYCMTLRALLEQNHTATSTP